MKRLIVNADDFGLTEGVNRAILDAQQRGIVTSTTLLANGAAFDSAVRLAREAPLLGVGIHLNVTDGRPVTRASSIPTLINEDGLFRCRPASLAANISAGRIRLDDIECELRAQIEKVQAAGVPVTHIDGHKHFHTWPSIFTIIIRLAREYGIRGIRCAAERPARLRELMRSREAAGRILKQYIVGRGLALLAKDAKIKLRRADLRCPQFFWGVTQTGFLDIASLEEILRSLPDGINELMCHPGYADAELARLPTRLQAQREKELEALTAPQIKALVSELQIQLISYRELTQGA